MTNTFTTPPAPPRPARASWDIGALVVSLLALAAAGVCVVAAVLTTLEIRNLHRENADLHARLDLVEGRSSKTGNEGSTSSETKTMILRVAQDTNEAFRSVSDVIAEMQNRIKILEAQVCVATPAPEEDKTVENKTGG